MLRKPHAGLSEFVNIRGFDFLLPVAAKLSITEIICKDVDDVGQLWFFFLFLLAGSDCYNYNES